MDFFMPSEGLRRGALFLLPFYFLLFTLFLASEVALVQTLPYEAFSQLRHHLPGDLPHYFPRYPADDPFYDRIEDFLGKAGWKRAGRDFFEPGERNYLRARGP